MSAGSFINSRYETDGGEILRCRVQPETELLTNGTAFNSAPVAAATLPWSMRIRPAKRDLGIIPRVIKVKFQAGTVPTGYKADQVLEIPIMTPAAFTALRNEPTLEYLNVQALVVGSSNEDYN